jgi:glycosyltransferase involved in cell wall biosynthesis
LPTFELDRGVRVYRIRGTMQRASSLFSEIGRRHAPPFPDPELVLELRRIIAREHPEIVHGHNWLVRSFLPLKRWSGARLVMTLHDYSLVCAKKSMLRSNAPCGGAGVVKCLTCAADHYGAIKGTPTVIGNWLMGAFERSLVDMFISVSQVVALKTGIAANGLPLQIIPNFVPDHFESNGGDNNPGLAQLPEKPFLLYVGDLRLFKGINTMLAAHASLTNAPPLVLIGRKDADTPTTFPANVVVLEPLPHDAVMQAWRKSLIGLLPSIGPETFGIAALEAMAVGRPVIASRIGGLPDIVIDGETGLLVPPGDCAQLRQAMERLLSDASLLKRMGQAAQQRALEFRASVIVPRIEQVYQTVMQNEK